MIVGRAGFFRELPHGVPDGESLREAMKGGKGQDEERLLSYLRGNTVLAATAATTDDALDPRMTAIAPLELVTDGAGSGPATSRTTSRGTTWLCRCSSCSR